jgi:hypothetical protein
MFGIRSICQPTERRSNKPVRTAGARSPTAREVRTWKLSTRGLVFCPWALRRNGFHRVDEFGAFVTFVRDGLKIHVGHDGSFSAFNGADECITEGKGAEDLRRQVLSARKPPCPTLPSPLERRKVVGGLRVA